MNDVPDQDFVVFTEALILSPAARAAYLNDACTGDAGMRGRIEALLQAHEKAGDFFAERPSGLPPASSALTGEKPGDRIGRYTLLQQIGEGGYGVVYMAQQEEPVRRRVALKVIKPGMDTRSVVARFEAERQALALMDHPNIAQVFDAGMTQAGRPYFVMELVSGTRITDYCDQNFLTTRDRLELIVQICDAVQHAHQKGIIHRDLKPSNILVATSTHGKPLPKVIDFGIAKATTGEPLTDKTIFTAYELLIGTPAYMSPEQAALNSADVDTRTDIYSLGVLLYELLIGTTPFDIRELLKAGLDEVRHAIRHQEPVRPSTRLRTMPLVELAKAAARRNTESARLLREVCDDLDWIVMKALEKERARRYATANSLAMDIQHYLSAEPVIARPPSASYRFRKLVSRNRVWFAGSALVLASLIVGLSITSWSLVREKRARREAEMTQRYLVDILRQSHGEFRQALSAAVASSVEVLRQENPPDDIDVFLEPLRQVDLTAEPVAAELLLARSEAFARHGLWKEAEADIAPVLRYCPDNSDAYHTLIPIYLITGNRKEYERIRLEVLAHFSGTSNAFVADRMAKDCMALPVDGHDLARLGSMADYAATCRTSQNPFFEVCEALAEYRRGHFEQAAHWAAPWRNDGYMCVRCEALVILAMSQWQMGLHSEARDTLSGAAKIIRQQIPQPESTDLTPDWRDWIIAYTLLNEATSMMDQTSIAVETSASR
ncbi:MAG TPA: serine/threonine-protein kinase [Alphaproteobacteria bacterium]|nr:serine/threonine-protein kinase [Alphaproteobacteria bacterium]